MFRVLAAGAACLIATAASAQSPYVALTVGADVSRFDRFVTAGSEWVPVDGEALAVAARAGTAVGESWGVEFELVYPSHNSLERIQGAPFIENPTSRNPQGATTLSFGGIGQSPQFHLKVKRRNTTADLAAWLAHNVRDGLQLRYLAGIAMHRFAQVNNVDVVRQPGLTVSSSNLGTRQEITYGIGPMAGIEARWRMQSRVFFAAGMRLHGFTSGWILRPSAGVGWQF
jgi:hypothetical protein